MFRRQIVLPLSQKNFMKTVRPKAAKLDKYKKDKSSYLSSANNLLNSLKKMTDDEFIKFAKRTLKKDAAAGTFDIKNTKLIDHL
jgi:hypothetical protein